MDVRVGLWRKLSTEELMLLNCGVGEDSWDFLGLQGDQTKGNQPWIFIGRTDAEAEAPILWPPAVTSRLVGKDPDAGKYWRQEEKGMTEDEMVGWHHWLNGHEFEQALRDGKGQGSLACFSPLHHKWTWYKSAAEQNHGKTCILNTNSPSWLCLKWTKFI